MVTFYIILWQSTSIFIIFIVLIQAFCQNNRHQSLNINMRQLGGKVTATLKLIHFSPAHLSK